MGLLSSRTLERMMPCTLATSNAIVTRETSSVRRLVNWRSRDYCKQSVRAHSFCDTDFISSFCSLMQAIFRRIMSYSLQKPLATEIAYTRLHRSSRITKSANLSSRWCPDFCLVSKASKWW
jgi:hypothetical protein